jgi:hypothetical protein
LQALEQVVRLGHDEGNECGHWAECHSAVAILFVFTACVLKNRNNNRDNGNICVTG